MKDKKKSSTTDVWKSARRASGVTNPFLLPDFDEENFDPSAEQARSAAKEVTTAPSTLWQKQAKGGVSFKKVAKAITKQRKWSSVLKVIDPFSVINAFNYVNLLPSPDWLITATFNRSVTKATSTMIFSISEYAVPAGLMLL